MSGSQHSSNSSLYSRVGDEEFPKLLERLFAGDEDAASRVDHHYRNRLIALVKQKMDFRVLQKEEPEDLAQSILRTFFRRAQNHEFEFQHPGALWCLLRKITINKVLKRADYWKAQIRDLDREEIAEAEQIREEPTEAQAWELGDALEAVLDDAELSSLDLQVFELQICGYQVKEVVKEIVDKLQEPYPRILQLRLQGLSERAIAEEMGLTREAIRYRMKRIESNLKRILGDTNTRDDRAF